MFKKILALMLALVMLTLPLVSCGDKKDKENESGEESSTTGAQNPGFENAEVDEYVRDLAEHNDFKGETFTWCGNERQTPDKEEETGDVRNDALYFRQRQIEDEFGLKWVNYMPTHVADSPNQPVVDAVMQDVLASTGAYDICYGTNVAVVQPLFIQNALRDMSEFQTVDLAREWWAPGIAESYNINGSLYFLTGPALTSFYEDAACIVYDKQIAEDYGIEGLYDLVYDGKWTFDKMIEIANVIPSNENGSGVYRYGRPNGMAVLYAHGYSLTSFNEEGLPYLVDQLPEPFYTVADKFSKIFGDNTITAHTKGVLNGDYEDVASKYGYKGFDDMFADHTMMFYFVDLGDVAWLRQADMEFGVLPMPKGSETQENYASLTTNTSNLFVSRAASNVKKTDVILEAVAALGYKYIKPTYYDKILKTRATYDHESKEMLDIICDTKIYDIIDFLSVGGDSNHDSALVMVVKGSIQEDASRFVGRYYAQARTVNRNIQTILKSIESDRNE